MMPARTTRDDRLLAPTRWVSTGVVPVLLAAFVILFLFPGSTMRLWGWMVCPHMSAYVIGGGYLSGAYFFARTSRSRSWHRVGVGFVATTVFSAVLLLVTALHWDVFNHDHVSFWAWMVLYVSTPVLLPVLWRNNRRTDPIVPAGDDVVVPRPVRLLVGAGGTGQLLFAGWILLWPDAAAGVWPWATDVTTLRVISAFVAFPAVTWLWFLFEDRWSAFRITQQTATLGLVLLTVGALRARGEFTGDGPFLMYVAALGVALALNATVYVAMERRARGTDRSATGGVSLDVLVGQRSWRAGQPTIDEGFTQRSLGDPVQLDEHGGVAVEVRDGEERLGLGGEHRLLLAEVLDPDGEDRTVRWRGMAEPPDVRLGERPFPGEGLAGDGPRAVAVALALGDLGQIECHPGRLVDRRHAGDRTPADVRSAQ